MVLLQVGTAGSVPLMKAFLDGKKMCIIYCKYSRHLSVLFPNYRLSWHSESGKAGNEKGGERNYFMVTP